MKFEMKNTIPFTLVPQIETLKYKSNKICLRSIWGKLQKSDGRIKELNNIEILYVHRQTHYCQGISSSQLDQWNTDKNPASCILNINKLILKFIWRGKDPEEPIQYWRRKKVGRLTLPNIKT